MKIKTIVGILLLLILTGCGHTLVAHSGDSTVAVYPDKSSFDQLKALQRNDGPAGLIAGLGVNLVAKQVNATTPIKVLECDKVGCEITVIDGPDKGLRGYVARDNVN